MPPFIDRDDLDRYTLGPARIDELLRQVGDNPADQQLILDGALEMGQAFILEFLPAAALAGPQVEVLKPIACREAVYLLKTQRNLGISETDEMMHLRRVAKLQDIRSRKMWAGDADNQRSISVGISESKRPIRTSQMSKGYL